MPLSLLSSSPHPSLSPQPRILPSPPPWGLCYRHREAGEAGEAGDCGQERLPPSPEGELERLWVGVTSSRSLWIPSSSASHSVGPRLGPRFSQTNRRAPSGPGALLHPLGKPRSENLPWVRQLSPAPAGNMPRERGDSPTDCSAPRPLGLEISQEPLEGRAGPHLPGMNARPVFMSHYPPI